MQKTISVLAIAGSIALLGASTAQAYPAPPAPVTGDIIDNDGVVIAGETITFTGGGFVNFGTINITIINNGSEPVGAGAGAGSVGAVRTGLIVLNQVVGNTTTKADANGNFAVPVELDAAGTYTLTATGLDPQGNERSVSSTVTVQAAAAAPIDKGTTGGTTGSTTGGTTGDTSTSTRGGLANTGIDSAMFLWGAAGIGALGLGAGSIVVARRRTGAGA
jgi:LPXTG-motif cell wall-anchored protein